MDTRTCGKGKRRIDVLSGQSSMRYSRRRLKGAMAQGGRIKRTISEGVQIVQGCTKDFLWCMNAEPCGVEGDREVLEKRGLLSSAPAVLIEFCV